jgi:hypothetical protein
MGEYTGLRFTAQLRPDVAEVVGKVVRDAEGYGIYRGLWEQLKEAGTPIPSEFLEYSRKNMIPFGMVCYMPNDWGDTQYSISPDGRWNVVCSAKDYGYHAVSMMETFVKKVLPLLIQEPCRAEILYEHWDESQFYEVTPHETPRVDAVD